MSLHATDEDRAYERGYLDGALGSEELRAKLEAAERRIAELDRVVSVARKIHVADLAALQELKELGVEPSDANSGLVLELGIALQGLDAASAAGSEVRG